MERRARQSSRDPRADALKRGRARARARDGLAPAAVLAEAAPRTLALAGQQQLQIVTANGHSHLHLVGSDGKARLHIEVTPDGPVLHLEGTGLKVEVHGDLSLTADRLALMGRRELVLSSGGDLHLHAQQDIHSEARIQNIKADLGNVNVKANDDVRLNGERVMVNC